MTTIIIFREEAVPIAAENCNGDSLTNHTPSGGSLQVTPPPAESLAEPLVYFPKILYTEVV
jgi:hypothetical protein